MNRVITDAVSDLSARMPKYIYTPNIAVSSPSSSSDDLFSPPLRYSSKEGIKTFAQNVKSKIVDKYKIAHLKRIDSIKLKAKKIQVALLSRTTQNLRRNSQWEELQMDIYEANKVISGLSFDAIKNVSRYIYVYIHLYMYKIYCR